MLDIGWSEILVIAVVLIVVVGPKDLPKMLRAFGKASSRMRKTANEFRRQFDEALREAELDDVKNVVNDARSLDPRTDIKKVFDPIRSVGEELRSSLNKTNVQPEATPVPPPPPEPVPSVDAPVEVAPAVVSASKSIAAVTEKPTKMTPKRAAPAKTTKPKASNTSKPAAGPDAVTAAKPRTKTARAKTKADETGSKA
ncbi:twin-arginine translocase subunit TatB [Phyllobacterium salinisoli]|uniref:Sec-independent protein translocase protein TatB n=1 Tax=Phyllobacterium salinisoli TaxID=1899321 RepID=A0A368K4C8_9HYPH|nr:Sec-independent protein translocase protein TatB [Phyllobacterium salinisoli]RCS24236.1 twin-arginine translocase subunit TatB [Phyllobacterium salinisoli]